MQTKERKKIKDWKYRRTPNTPKILNNLETVEEGLAIPNGRAIPNTPPFMINAHNMAYFQL